MRIGNLNRYRAGAGVATCVGSRVIYIRRSNRELRAVRGGILNEIHHDRRVAGGHHDLRGVAGADREHTVVVRQRTLPAFYLIAVVRYHVGDDRLRAFFPQRRFIVLHGNDVRDRIGVAVFVARVERDAILIVRIHRRFKFAFRAFFKHIVQINIRGNLQAEVRRREAGSRIDRYECIVDFFFNLHCVAGNRAILRDLGRRDGHVRLAVELSAIRGRNRYIRDRRESGRLHVAYRDPGIANIGIAAGINDLQGNCNRLRVIRACITIIDIRNISTSKHLGGRVGTVRNAGNSQGQFIAGEFEEQRTGAIVRAAVVELRCTDCYRTIRTKIYRVGFAVCRRFDVINHRNRLRYDSAVTRAVRNLIPTEHLERIVDTTVAAVVRLEVGARADRDLRQRSAVVSNTGNHTYIIGRQVFYTIVVCRRSRSGRRRVIRECHRSRAGSSVAAAIADREGHRGRVAGTCYALKRTKHVSACIRRSGN